MKISKKQMQRLTAYGVLVVIVIVFAWLNSSQVLRFDLSSNQRNTLSEASKAVLAELSGPVKLTAYTKARDPARATLKILIERYQLLYPNIKLEFIDPTDQPQQVRELNVATGGELFVHYQERSERLQKVNEHALTNALQRLLRQGERWLVFLQGHGERDPLGKANHDLGELGKRLTDSGLRVQPHDFLLLPVIPENTGLLIIAGPSSPYLPGEIALLQRYLRDGGNLLWMLEPGHDRGYQDLSVELGVGILPGVVVDAETEKLNLSSPDFALLSRYPKHPVTKDISSMTLLPQAAALEVKPSDWIATPLLQTLARSWNETSAIVGEISPNPEHREVTGPLTVGFALSRPSRNKQEQRVIVIGDGDFLSNAYFQNGANLELGLKMINWLAGDDDLIDIQQTPDADVNLEISKRALLVFALVFWVALPSGFLITAGLLWRRRRHA